MRQADCSNGSGYELSQEKDCFYRAIYDGKDTWTDESGVEWNKAVK